MVGQGPGELPPAADFQVVRVPVYRNVSPELQTATGPMASLEERPQFELEALHRCETLGTGLCGGAPALP